MSAITLQATGYPPTTFNGAKVAEAYEALPKSKRGVRLELFYRADTQTYAYVLTYDTQWRDERPLTRIYWGHDPEEMAAWVRDAALTILPPGAGFPPQEAFAPQQERLKGLMAGLTLSCLTSVLQDWAKRKAR